MAKAVVETTDRRIYGTFGWAQVGLIGGILGAVWYGLSLLIGNYIVDPLICRGDALEACAQSGALAVNIAGVVVAIIGATLLIRMHIHRAMGVALAGLIAFWNLQILTEGLPWFESLAWFILINALGYLLFTNLFRIRRIYIAVIMVAIAILLVRWVAFL